jgi:hypothetical protein
MDGLAPIARAVGFAGAAAPLDADTRRAIGLAGVGDARIVAGPGAARALLVDTGNALPLRDVLPRLAAKLSARTPHVLWLLLAVDRQTEGGARHVAFAAWPGDCRPPRLSALVVERARVIDSDADTLRALAAAGAAGAVESDLVMHARWVEILGRNALTLRFYRALEHAVDALAASSNHPAPAARGEIALLTASRLLFLSFLEAKGWLDGDRAFLANRFDRCMAAGGGFHRRVLQPLFFGTLNTPFARRATAARQFGNIPFLNGGLFSRAAVERPARGAVPSDEAYGVLLSEVFAPYRFTAREESAQWTEVAVDPEMLGRAFESLMAAGERRRTGAFFTPFALVQRAVDAALESALAGVVGDCAGALIAGERIPAADHQRVCELLARFTVLDPACGSGAFLVHTLERVAALRAQLGDDRPPSLLRRKVLTRSIFGVDVNPMAVWLCQLRLWLSVVIDGAESNPADVLPLPNLDRNVRAGDALAGRAFGEGDDAHRDAASLGRLRERYVRASGARKESLARQLDRAERRHAVAVTDDALSIVTARRRDVVVARRGRDLFGATYAAARQEELAAANLRREAAALRAARRRVAAGGALPFSFPVHFADVAAHGGFALVVGNPPWVRLHHVAPRARATFRRDYEVARAAAWEPGATPAGAGRGFAAQVDVAALFVERSVRLLAPGGTLALLLPVKLWRSLAGGGVRRLLMRECRLRRVEDHTGAPALFDAAVYPSLVVAERQIAAPNAPIAVSTFHAGARAFDWTTSAARLPFDETPGAPWLLLPPDARDAFALLASRGRPLAASALGRPYLGVKCGCNDAFIVRVRDTDVADGDDEVAHVQDTRGRCGVIERALLRPLLRGEQLERWRAPRTTEAIVWTHDARGAPLATLPPHAARWLAGWRRELFARADARRAPRWWSLFRTESARGDVPRVVWADVGREPRASVLAAGDDAVPLNSCYVVRCRDERDAYAFAALLNGPLARAWLSVIAEPARGGYRRYLGWTLALLPVPRDWDAAREILAPLADRCRDRPPGDGELLARALTAYGVSHGDVAALVGWAFA